MYYCVIGDFRLLQQLCKNMPAGACRLNSKPHKMLIYSFFCVKPTICDCSSNFHKKLLHGQHKTQDCALGHTDPTGVHLSSLRGSGPICRKIVALSPGANQAPVLFLRGTPCPSRLLRYSATPEIRFTPRQRKPSGLHSMFRPSYP